MRFQPSPVSRTENKRSGSSRRSALGVSVLGGSGLSLAFSLGLSLPARPGVASQPSWVEFNAFVEIGQEGRILIYNKCPEVGQGIQTAFPMIVADELDAAWEDVHVGQAPINTKVYGHQRAAASYAILSSWDQLRSAGAVVRHMLISAAANIWSVDRDECSTRESKVFHQPTGRTLSYGELVHDAIDVPIPDPSAIPLKDEKDFRLIGKWVGGVENGEVVSGQPLYVSDISLPDMLYATYEKCPAFGGRVASANLEQVRALSGVIDAFVLEGTGRAAEIMPGVAIVATSTWAALQAKQALRVEWDEGGAATDSWSQSLAKAIDLAAERGNDIIVETGDVEQAIGNAALSLQATYSYPFIAHAPMEPQSCVAWHQGEEIKIWSSTQTPDTAINSIADLFRLDPKNVTLHQLRAGGAFGRRLYNDFVCEAVAISERVGAPVKLQWAREDDMRHDHYRPGGVHHVEGALDDRGRLIALRNHFVTFTHTGETTVRVGDMDAEEFPAGLIDNIQYTRSMLPWTTPTGALRAPKANAFAFVFQSFIHELATAAGRDHVEFLLEILGEPRWLDPGNVWALHTGRAAQVVKVAAERSGWGRVRTDGRSLGLGFYFSHASYFAEVAEVSVDAANRIVVHKVYVVGDAGKIVNFSGAMNQCEGSVIDGISAMFGQSVSIENGRIEEGNFDQYPLLKMADAPDVDVHLIQSDNSPTGLGEPALPPIIPAVANAIFAASGRRVRSLPLRKNGFNV